MDTAIHWEMADMKQNRSTSEISQDSSSNNRVEQQEMKDDVVLDIEEKIKDIKDGFWPPTCCIYRVPPMIRKLNKDAYTPMAVLIGPFHYRDERLQDMEEHKKVLFKRFTQKAKASLDEMISSVKHLVPRVRASYSENIARTEKELVELVLMDATFIIEVFTSAYMGEIHKDAKLSQTYLLGTVVKDLLLLENQLPFFLIEELFNMVFPLMLPSFLHLTCSFFEHYTKQNVEANPNVRFIEHFTDLLRLSYLPTSRPTRDSLKDEDPFLQYSANELHEAGVKFRKRESKSLLLDLKFSGHVLEIPQILLDDTTELLFRNMIALEQCHYPDQSYIVDYAVMMDCLINSNKDVDVLTHKEIIHNWLGDTNDVATLFNGLNKNIIGVNFSSEYLDIGKRLNQFYRSRLHMMKATMRRDYCNTPWKTVATVAGIIVIILTVVQTIFSIPK